MIIKKIIKNMKNNNVHNQNYYYLFKIYNLIIYYIIYYIYIQVKNIMQQLLAAVSHIHRRGIMHRNLKPKHILVIPGNGPDPLGYIYIIYI